MLSCCWNIQSSARGAADEWASPASSAAPPTRSAPLPIHPPKARGRVASGDRAGFSAEDYAQTYDLGPVIGRGSTSTVHRSKHRASGRVVATKVITGEQLRGGFDGPSARIQERTMSANVERARPGLNRAQSRRMRAVTAQHAKCSGFVHRRTSAVLRQSLQTARNPQLMLWEPQRRQYTSLLQIP